MMTKKDYELIALGLSMGIHSGIKEMTEKQYIRWIVLNLAEMLARNNPKFNKEKFAKSCGIEYMPQEACEYLMK